ncbi:uncharacterized protein ARMOST_10115 [Armillaria ostoyae]|uniref:Uncharacterized protein n=1 Tax=Armillaria ostoyae TaxID=47428 RepID=A0A284RDD7_ARMOS|nr:uncharacterized protein ARMOST_10115 [Armillaria ostoyae]
MANIAEENGININLLKGRYKAGMRVVYLVAEGGMWIIPILVVLQMKARILYYNTDRKESRDTTNEDVSGLTFAIRDPFKPDMTTLLEALASTTKALNEKYGGYFKLPHHQEQVWGVLDNHMQIEPISREETSDNNVEPILRILKIPIKLDLSLSLVMKKNRDSWIKKERGRAEEAQQLGGHEETYQDQASSETKSDGIDSPSSSAQCVLQQWQKANGKVYPTGFQQATKMYNRYNQKGTGAPKDIHPHRLCIVDKKSNPTQRLPHYGQQVIEDLDWHKIIQNIFKPLMGLLHNRIKAFLPAEYDKLEGVANNLMMNEDSTVHPFSVFMLNFRACSSAH